MSELYNIYCSFTDDSGGEIDGDPRNLKPLTFTKGKKLVKELINDYLNGNLHGSYTWLPEYKPEPGWIIEDVENDGLHLAIKSDNELIFERYDDYERKLFETKGEAEEFLNNLKRLSRDELKKMHLLRYYNQGEDPFLDMKVYDNSINYYDEESHKLLIIMSPLQCDLDEFRIRLIGGEVVYDDFGFKFK